jgi:hypothetical protein
MKKKSSNENMETIFQKLSEIKKVEPDLGLYLAISNRLKKHEKINKKWLSIAAAIFLIVFSSEIWLVKRNNSYNKTNELQLLVPETNNLLYNE